MNLENSDYAKTLLKYIGDLTVQYRNAATQDEEKITRLGLTSERITKITRKSGLQEATANAQKIGTTDMILTDSCFGPIIGNAVKQDLNEKHIQNELVRTVNKLRHDVREIEDYNEFLERELETVKEVDSPAEKNTGHIKNLRRQVHDCERKINRFTDSTMNDENIDLNNILEEIVRMDKEIDENLAKTTNCTTTITKKYKDLPANVLSAKDKLIDLQHKCKKLDTKVKTFLNP